jgi:hypothetical protein
LTDRFDEAVSHSRKAIEGNRNFAFAYCVLALGCVRLERHEEALQVIRQLIAAVPSFRIDAFRQIHFADAARLQSDLALLQAAHQPG